MQGLLWARCRPRVASLEWIGHRFRTAGKKPSTSSNEHSSRSKWVSRNQTASSRLSDDIPGLSGTNVSANTVLEFFKSNVGSWTLRRTVHDRLVSFGAPARDVTKLLEAFSHDADAGFFDGPDAIEKYQLMKLRGSDPIDSDVTFSNIFFQWLAAQGSVRGVNSSTTGALLRISEAAAHMHPEEEWERARRMKRKFIMHVGPTNSGKTHHALRALAAAPVGVYAGPLRLLAYEIWERMNLGQIVPLGATEEQIAEAAKFGPSVDNPFARVCNMITGEEQKMVGTGKAITSCTVEMLQILAHADVAVIDEIQMIADRERGFGWARAVLGICATEVHLCGEETAVPLIRELLKETGDEIVVNRYERLTPLEVEETSLEGDLSRVRKGDCIVAFSRSAIFSLKRLVEEQTGMKCAVVYGKLPPEIRSEQAALFNDPNSGYDVLIGSDAIGMGLNLKIRRVIFEAVKKFEGPLGHVTLSVSQMKQIAGRAGRFGMQDADETPGGFVTTLRVEDLPVLRKTLQLKVPPLSYARITHTRNTLADITPHLPAHASTETVYLASLHAGKTPMHCRNTYPNQLSTICEYLDQQGHFTHSDRLLFIQAPFPWRDTTALDAITEFVAAYYENMHVDVMGVLRNLGYLDRLENAERAMNSVDGRANGRRFQHSKELMGLETFHKILVVYMWLSYRNPVSYPSQDAVVELKERLERSLHWCLQEMTRYDATKPAYVKAIKPVIDFKSKRDLQLYSKTAA